MEKEQFKYTYSADEQEELKKIRQKYEPQEESKMEQLRRLDAGVTQKATMYAIIIGVLGALILGTGMSLSLTEIGDAFGLGTSFCMILGIIIGLLGIVLVAAAYPVYSQTIKKEREKVAPQILLLTEELMK